MKKSIVLGIAGMAIAAVSSFGQGYVTLDNYVQNSGGSLVGSGITYGANVPANGATGAFGSGGLNGSWTVGLYFVVGTPAITDPAGSGIPASPLALASGTGSTAVIFDSANGTAGAFTSGNQFQAAAAAGTVITYELIAYPTSAGSYANAAYRGHGGVFTVTTTAGNSTTPAVTSNLAADFTVSAVPEPTTLALAGLGGFGMLMALRRKQA